MAEKKKKQDISEEQAEVENIPVDTAEQAESEQTEEKKDKKEKKEKKSAQQQQLEQLQDKFLRLAADFDNYKKRTNAEKEALRAVVVSDTVQMMLPILDNLERAVLAAGDEESALKDGVVMVLNQAKTGFEKFGIEAFGERGEAFNPEMHNAIMTCEDEQLQPDTIAEVLQKGYRIGDKIIRHALVKVVQ